jgi:hypothetical protein
MLVRNKSLKVKSFDHLNLIQIEKKVKQQQPKECSTIQDTLKI